MKFRSLFVALTLLCISIITFTTSCQHDLPVPATGTNTTIDSTISSLPSSVGWKCSADTVYFQYDVLPVLVSSCAISGCHDAIKREDGYQFTDYTSSVKKGISAGKASSSKVYTEIANGSMPPRSSGITMTQAQKDIIAKWINQGAKNLTCNPNYGQCDTTNVKFSTFVSGIIKNKCQGCHTTTQPLLTNYTQIKAAVQSGKLWGSIAHLSGYSAMPQGSAKLPDCELSKINAWIKAGALNN